MIVKKLKSGVILIFAYLFRVGVLVRQYFQSIPSRIKKDKKYPMVFCIGYQKTGTTSLDNALKILGYNSIHWPRAHLKPRKGWINYIKKCPYDAFLDAPISFYNFFKTIDHNFPHSKFILTVREPLAFLKSWDNYFKYAPWRVETQKEKEELLKEYKNHINEVTNYFKDRPSQLLVFDIFKGDEWNKLCKFLEQPIPKIPFPHKRRTKYKEKK